MLKNFFFLAVLLVFQLLIGQEINIYSIEILNQFGKSSLLNEINSSPNLFEIDYQQEDNMGFDNANKSKANDSKSQTRIEEAEDDSNLTEEESPEVQSQFHSNQEKKLLTATLIACAAIILLIVAILFLVRNKKLTNEIAKNQEYIQEQLVVKESLLSEIHHRVKNNLQIISSMLSLQTKYITDEKLQRIINDCKGRIRSMSLIHESLYKKIDGEEALFSSYIRTLIPRLIRTYQIDENKIKLEMDLEEVQLTLDESIPCGLIINEIVSNSLKHAFANGLNGQIYISLKKVHDMVEMIVSDNGPGLKKKINFDNHGSFGFLLIDTLAKQLEARLEIESHNKMEYKLSFISSINYE